MTLEKTEQQCEKGIEPCEKITAKKTDKILFRGDIIEKVWLSCQIEANIPH